ncbi:MAG: toll/interleukin-1 receptor domain-containing protein, partial [Spirochaetales bacterium]|nr:toll/interleukin-1 receptor domain-containing protein [Spirochaetales bacterium]
KKKAVKAKKKPAPKKKAVKAKKKPAPKKKAVKAKKKPAPKKKAVKAKKKPAPKKKAVKAKKKPAPKKKAVKAKKKPAPGKKTVTVKKKPAVEKQRVKIEPPFKAYTGDKPYLYISYSHKDMEKVYAIISRLYMSGFHIWYDEGLERDQNREKTLGEAIRNCGQFIVFVTPDSIKSTNVKNEITLAIMEERNVVPVYLMETTLPNNMKVIFDTLISLKVTGMSPETIYQKILTIVDQRLKD